MLIATEQRDSLTWMTGPWDSRINHKDTKAQSTQRKSLLSLGALSVLVVKYGGEL